MPLDFTDVALCLSCGKGDTLDDDGDIVDRHENPSSGIATVPRILVAAGFPRNKSERAIMVLSNPLPIIQHRTKIARVFPGAIKSPIYVGRGVRKIWNR